ncbi:MAG TPA: tetratricopeptide repeat protein [Pyrinomonadaceae bacterium]|nr:tetratricopeptide repeat protein [Pyrinomonadaceae bacterium]
MGFLKSKVVKAAEKFLSQGKINAAIKEYRQIVANDNDDLTALNMLGDLLARAGEKDEAAVCFLRIAEHYREQEFRLKAIAMYKKIEKLKPNDPEIAGKLADLYSAQGLVVDARAQYLVVADAFTRAGNNKEALQVLHKIADLDPQNTQVRIKLAEGYLKEGMQPEAAKAFSDAGGRLFEKGDYEKSLDAYTKALELRPQDKAVLRGLVSVHVALGTGEDAAEIVEKAVEADPEDAELLEMLAHAYVESGDASGAERATSRLMAQDASNHRRYIDVIRLYLKQGNATDAARILELIIEPMLSGREETDLVELITDLLETAPEHVAGLRLLAQVHWWQRDMEKLRSVLELMADSAENSGLTEDERYALTQLVRLAPDEQRFSDRLEELGGSLEDLSEGPQLVDPSLSEVPSFDGFAFTDSESAGGSEPEVSENPQPEFEWNSVAEASIPDPSSSFADLNEVDDAAGSEVSISSDSSSTEFAYGDIDPTPPQVEEAADESSTAKVQTMMQQELESVDFYITQGYSDIALDTLELLERQFGSHPEIDSRRTRLRAGTPAGAATHEQVDVIVSEPEFQTEEAVDPGVQILFDAAEQPAVSDGPPSQPLASGPVSTGIDSGLAEIFEEFRLEAEGDDHAVSTEDYETYYNMATAYKEMDLLDEAIREFQAAAALASPVDGTARYFQCCNMLGHCFVEKSMPQAAVLWFKKGIETPGRSQEEYKALQYELGSAYEQMEDLTQAAAAFTEVYGVDVGYRDIAERLHNLQVLQKQRKQK